MNSKALIFGLVAMLAISAFAITADAGETDAAIDVDIGYIGDDTSGDVSIATGFQPTLPAGGYVLRLDGPMHIPAFIGGERDTLSSIAFSNTPAITQAGTYTYELYYLIGSDRTDVASGSISIAEVTFTDGSTEAPMFIGGTVDVPTADDLGFRGEGDFLGWATTEGGAIKFAVDSTMSALDLDGITTLYAVFGDMPEPVLTEITVTGPTDTEYDVGQPLSLNGLVVTAVYDRGEPTILGTDDYEIQIPEGAPELGQEYSKAGLYTYVVSYTEGGITETATFTITVKESGTPAVPVTDVTLDKTTATLDVDETVTLTATVAPSNATNKDVTWTSSNPAVATVVNGVVTAKAAGTAVITVTTEDGGKTASCTVTVNGKTPEPVVLNSITIGTMPSQTVYEQDESLNLEGLKVIAHYSDGSRKEVENYTTSPANGDALGTLGTITVTVTFEGKTTTFDVRVVEKTYDIAYETADNGSISGDRTVAEGDDAGYSVEADYGYVIDTLTVDGTDVSEASGLIAYDGVIENVTSDMEVSVTFKADTASSNVTVTVSGSGGVVTPSGTVPVYDHWGAILYVDVDSGYEAIVSGGVLYNEVDGTITIPAGSDITSVSVEFVFTGSTGDDDMPPRPPVNIPAEDDDTTTYIVAIAAAAVVAILAALILMQTRKS